MVRADLLRLLGSRGDQGASGQVIGFPEETSGSLMNSGDGLLTEEAMVNACNFQVMV